MGHLMVAGVAAAEVAVAAAAVEAMTQEES